MKEYVPNPVIVRRAVELWCREIVRGRHDNGDRSHAGFMAEMLASMIPSNAADESVLGAFGCALEQLLLNKTAFTKDELKPRIELSECGRYQDSLHTDYGPDVTLATAAETAGLKCEMPWKSHTWLYEDKLSARFGYSDPLLDARTGYRHQSQLARLRRMAT